MALRLRGEVLTAPELVDLEVASILRRQARAAAIDARRADLALADLAVLPMRRAPHLLTGDPRLARVDGPRCDIEVLRTPR